MYYFCVVAGIFTHVKVVFMHGTLTLPDDIADVIGQRVAPTRGTVVGYARQWTILLAQLSNEDEAEIKALVEMRIRRRALADRALATADAR